MGLFGAKHKRSDAQLHQLLDDAHAGSDQCVRVLLRRTDLYPVYISPNFRTMLGVDPQRYIDDVHVLLRHIPAEEQPNLRRAVKAWDRTGKLSQLCAYDMPGNQPVRKHFRITTTPTANGEHYLVEFIDVTEEQQAIEQACQEVQRETPMGAYAVEYITYTVSQDNRPYSEIKLALGYRRTEEQVKSIVHATSISALHALLTAAAETSAEELVVQVGYFQDQAQEVRDIVAQEQQEQGREPDQWQVNFYPNETSAGIIEILMKN